MHERSDYESFNKLSPNIARLVCNLKKAPPYYTAYIDDLLNVEIYRRRLVICVWLIRRHGTVQRTIKIRRMFIERSKCEHAGNVVFHSTSSVSACLSSACWRINTHFIISGKETASVAVHCCMFIIRIVFDALMRAVVLCRGVANDTNPKTVYKMEHVCRSNCISRVDFHFVTMSHIP